MRTSILSFISVVILILGLCSCHIDHTTLYPLSASQYSTTLSSEDVTSMVMDSCGYMWIGTSDGLNLYDGYRYCLFSHKQTDSTSIPSNQIVDLFSDSRNRIWVLTSKGPCLYLGNDRFYTIALPISYGAPYQILENDRQELFFVTPHALIRYHEEQDSCSVMMRYEAHTKNTQQFLIDSKNCFWRAGLDSITGYDEQLHPQVAIDNFPAINIVRVMMKDDCIWSVGGNGLLRYDIAHRQSKQVADSVLFTQRDILPRQIVSYRGKICLFSKDKIYTCDEATLQFAIDTTMTHLLYRHFSSLLSTVYVDHRKNLWVGFPNRGYSNLSQFNNEALLSHTSLVEYLRGRSVRALTRHGSMLWGLYGNSQVFAYNVDTKAFRTFEGNNIPGIMTRRFEHQLSNICYANDKLWLMTDMRLMRYTDRGSHLQLEEVFRFGMRNITVKNPCTLSDGTLYVSNSKGGIYRLGATGRQIENIPVPLSTHDVSSVLLARASGSLLICTPHLHFATFQPHRSVMDTLSVTCPISTQEIAPLCMLEDKQQRVWIGTTQGLFCLSSDGKQLTPIKAVSGCTVQSIEVDADGTLWMGTRQELVRYVPATDRATSFTSLSAENGRTRVYNQQSSCCIADSTFFFGHSRGCVAFTPHAMKQNYIPQVHIERLLVNSANGTQGIDCLHQAFKEIHLRYDENDLTLYFGTVSYGLTSRHNCLYKMEGFDPDWIQGNDSRQAIYSNLPAGKYTFHIKLVSAEGSEVYHQQMHIIVDPAPWKSKPALLLYILLFLGLIIYINQLYLRIKSGRIRMQMLQRDKEREHTTNQMNMNFFANISHEFRNPLTMILGPISSMKGDKRLSTDTHQQLNIILRSINQMLKLIDQMLDFNKLETDALKMQVSHHDIAYEVARWVETFQAGAAQKDIQVECKGLEQVFFTWIDLDKLAKILSNLFTNALKHTPQGGTIIVGLEQINREEALQLIPEVNEAQRYVHLYVHDSGRGIPEAQLADIFKRYYQVDNQSGLKYANWGTGIGLYYVKRLAQLHHGDVVACNADIGAIFHVLFPVDEACYDHDERLIEPKHKIEVPTEVLPPALANNTLVDPDKPFMLIVDDDIQVSYYLRTLFADEYNVVNKYSAESALVALESLEPDIILSDVVMGEMSGYDFCRQLKNDRLYCHIPIVLLTAKTQINEQVEGLHTGASAYVTKPFDANYLHALVQSIRRNKEFLRTLLTSSDNSEKTEKQVSEALSPQDMSFMKELYALLDSMMTHDDINFNDVAERLCMSRSKFNYKLKGLTGETPIHFFMKYKLNKAAQLLKSGKYNVSEVAYITGFGTISHFSVSFKKHFGVSPSEYK